MPSVRNYFAEWTVKTPNGKDWRINFYDEVVVDERKINQELAEHPAKFALWATMHGEAKERVAYLELERDRLESDLGNELVNDTPAGEKKPTEKQIELYVTGHEKYRKLENELLKVKALQERLYIARDAMTHRRDVLVALATNLRREMDVDLGRRASRIAETERERERVSRR